MILNNSTFTPPPVTNNAEQTNAKKTTILARPAFQSRSDNPYNWLLYTSMKNLGVEVIESSLKKSLFKTYSIWHLHWPEFPLNDQNIFKSFARILSLLIQIDWIHLRGGKVVWTAHNLGSQEKFHPRLEQWFWQVFTRKLDGYISLSETAKDALQEHFPNLNNLPGFVIPHGHYRGEYPDQVTLEQARKALNIPLNAKVLLSFGRIRPYKNLPQLIEAFRQFSDPDSILYIVGYPEIPELTETLQTAAALDPRIRLHLDFIPKENAQLYFRAADLVVLPYREILNSGTALLALSFDRPVLVPVLGSLGELQSQVGSEWVQTYPGDLHGGQIENALSWAMNTPRPHQAPLDALDWNILAQKTIDAYQMILNQ